MNPPNTTLRPERVLPTQVYREVDSRYEDRRIQVLAVLGKQGRAICQTIANDVTPSSIGKKNKVKLDRLLREPHLTPFYEFVSGPLGDQDVPDWPATMVPQSPVSHRD